MKNVEQMKILNPDAAGIDVGSKSHFLAIDQADCDMREFGVYSKEHEEMIEFLNGHHIKTITMESTGSYWQTFFLRCKRQVLKFCWYLDIKLRT